MKRTVEDVLHESRKLREELKYMRSIFKGVTLNTSDVYIVGNANARIEVIDIVIMRINKILGEESDNA